MFARHGFHKASLQAIWEEAGISRGSIVWHFGTKDALLEAVVERSYLSWAPEFDGSESGKPGGRQAIVRVIEAHRRFIEEAPADNRLYYALIAEVSASPTTRTIQSITATPETPATTTAPASAPSTS